MKLVKFFILFFIITFTGYQALHAQDWVLAGSVPSPGTQPSISTIDGNTAWIGGGPANQPRVYRTTDGGLTWDSIPTDGFSKEVYCLWAVNLNTVFAGEGNLSGNAKLFKTTNSGLNWVAILQTGNNEGFFNGIVFSKRNSGRGNGIALAERIYKTSNYGTNWVMQQSGAVGVSNAHNSLMVIDFDFYGFGLNNGASRIKLTTNAGTSWAIQNVNLTGHYTSAISFLDNKLFGLSATSASLPFISRTTDCGITWIPIDIGPGVTGNCFIKWIPETPIVYILGNNGGIKKSTDEGLTWTLMGTAGVTNLYHFDFERYNNNVVYGYAVSTNGSVIKLADSILIIMGNQNITAAAPDKYSLGQNYPNPFNPITTIKYSVPQNNINVKIAVYDLLGRETAVLVNETQNAGNYEVTFDGSNLSSGMYFYKLQAGTEFSDVKKMILTK
jgi:photosystem II stability/assembly factor-like uncharacterized protein